jgi:transcriptional regulator with XRE-family HTH domain
MAINRGAKMKNLGYYGRRNICGERVRMARLAKRISQETLAAKMQTLGVNIAQDAISNIEAGRRLVMDYELRAFATVLQVPIEELLEPEEE